MLKFLALPLTGLVMGFAGGWKVHDWKDAEGALKVVGVVQRQGEVSVAAGIGEERAQERVRVVTRTLHEKVPVYVTPEADRRCSVPVGFVRLHDAAVAGVPGPAEPAGEPDDAPAGVALSRVGDTIVDNYGVARACQAELSGLQAWIGKQRDAANGAKR